MVVAVSYPGVHVEELPSTTHTVTQATTSSTAFVGFFPRGPMSNRPDAPQGDPPVPGLPTRVASFREFTRLYGGLDARSEASYGLLQYFNNGGQTAWVIRVADGQATASRKFTIVPKKASEFAAEQARKATTGAATIAQEDSPPFISDHDGTVIQDIAKAKAEAAREIALVAAKKAMQVALSAQAAAVDASAAAGGEVLEVRAANPGQWGNCLHVGLIPGKTRGQFTLSVAEVLTTGGRPTVVARESYPGLTLEPGQPNNVKAVVNHASSLVRVSFPDDQYSPGWQFSPGDVPTSVSIPSSWPKLDEDLGKDGTPTKDAGKLTGPQGMGSLDSITSNVFNILSIPEAANLPGGAQSELFVQAHNYCDKNHAVFIVDIPKNIETAEQMQAWAENGYTGEESYSAIAYYPRLEIPDPLAAYQPRNVGASGTMAGVYARTDTSRGVWRAPAGIEAVLEGANLAVPVTNDDSSILNSIGVNALRSFPIYGNVSWGARTLAGADLLDNQWKYVNVRRLADFVEQSLVLSLKWVVFEPNDETTWSQIRAEVGSFLSGLFADGAFSGASASEAYLVVCDDTTTTAADIDRGIVNILVGIAPVKPAEFVVLQIELLAGQSPS